jgi:hypothetical protein
MSTYDPLYKIIPPDQALANKALEAALQQIKGIFDSNLTALATATDSLESNVNLPLINALTRPLPQNVIDYWTKQFVRGTGPNSTLRLVDVIGSPTGWINIDALNSTNSIINSLAASGALNSLINGTNGVYTVMENCINGDYTETTEVPNPTPPPDTITLYNVVIPPGLPGAGTYGTFDTASAAQGDAFTAPGGLNQAMQSAVAAIIAANPELCGQANANFNSMAEQLARENYNLALTSINFALLISNYNYQNLMTNLPQYALDIAEGGTAYYFASIANTNTIGGQAVISTMRESRNRVLLQNAGIVTESNISDVTVVPIANTGPTQYTTAQATAQKVV